MHSIVSMYMRIKSFRTVSKSMLLYSFVVDYLPISPVIFLIGTLTSNFTAMSARKNFSEHHVYTKVIDIQIHFQNNISNFFSFS